MKFNNLKAASDAVFRRITGVKRSTFDKMSEILKEAEALRKARGGRPNKLILEDRLLMTLEYLREYRTYAHIGMSYGLSESNTYQTIKWIENVLVKSPEFRLSDKKALLNKDMDLEVVLVDATETPIERPKKNNEAGIQERKNVIR